MGKQEYMRVLQNAPSLELTFESMAQLCPHLDPSAALDMFKRGRYVECPGVLVRNSVHALILRDDTIRWEGARQVDPREKRANVAAAVRYAKEHWGAELIQKTWKDAVDICVDDPRELDQRGEPTTKTQVRVGLKRAYNTLINDHRKPASVVFDDAILVMSAEPLARAEIRNTRSGVFDVSVCANCGYGLSVWECRCCGHKFPRAIGRCGNDRPIPRKVAELLQSRGFVFGQDPKIAWQKELADIAEMHAAFERAGTRAATIRPSIFDGFPAPIRDDYAEVLGE